MDPDTITQFFGRLRDRLAFDQLSFKSLRRFMDTYGEELGFSMAPVAMRSGRSWQALNRPSEPGRPGPRRRHGPLTRTSGGPVTKVDGAIPGFGGFGS